MDDEFVWLDLLIVVGFMLIVCLFGWMIPISGKIFLAILFAIYCTLRVIERRLDR